MIQRQCPQCKGELALARRHDQQSGAGYIPGPSNVWRCGICGQTFTAEQIREDKRSKESSKNA